MVTDHKKTTGATPHHVKEPPAAPGKPLLPKSSPPMAKKTMIGIAAPILPVRPSMAPVRKRPPAPATPASPSADVENELKEFFAPNNSSPFLTDEDMAEFDTEFGKSVVPPSPANEETRNRWRTKREGHPAIKINERTTQNIPISNSPPRDTAADWAFELPEDDVLLPLDDYAGDEEPTVVADASFFIQPNRDKTTTEDITVDVPIAEDIDVPIEIDAAPPTPTTTRNTAETKPEIPISEMRENKVEKQISKSGDLPPLSAAVVQPVPAAQIANKKIMLATPGISQSVETPSRQKKTTRSPKRRGIWVGFLTAFTLVAGTGYVLTQTSLLDKYIELSDFWPYSHPTRTSSASPSVHSSTQSPSTPHLARESEEVASSVSIDTNSAPDKRHATPSAPQQVVSENNSLSTPKPSTFLHQTVVFPARFGEGKSIFWFEDKNEEKAFFDAMATQATNQRLVVKGYITPSERESGLTRLAISRAWSVHRYLQKNGIHPKQLRSETGNLKQTLPSESNRLVTITFEPATDAEELAP